MEIIHLMNMLWISTAWSMQDLVHILKNHVIFDYNAAGMLVSMLCEFREKCSASMRSKAELETAEVRYYFNRFCYFYLSLSAYWVVTGFDRFHSRNTKSNL